MDRALRELVWQRANNCCEYCRMPQEYDDGTFEIDHIISASHGGPPRASNLCLACFSCNSFKGPNLRCPEKSRKGSRNRKRKDFAGIYLYRQRPWFRLTDVHDKIVRKVGDTVFKSLLCHPMR